MEKRRAITAEDLYRIYVLNEPQLSPDGSTFAYIRKQMNSEKEYTSNLFVQSTVENKPTQWTFGKEKVSSPRFSPDGEYIVYVGKKEKDEESQLYLISTCGGESKPLTKLKNGVAQPIWSPSGKKILFACFYKENEIPNDNHNNKTPEKKTERKEPLIVERLTYKSDANGFLDGKRKQLAIYDVETEKITFLTNSDTDHEPWGWSPDEKKIVFSANKEGDQKLVSDLYLLDVETKEAKLLTNKKGMYYGASFSPDGTKLAYYGHNKEFMGATNHKIHLLDLQSGEVKVLTENWDVHVTDAAISDLRSGHPTPPPIWSRCGEKLFFTASINGSTNFYSVDLNGKVETIFAGAHHVYGYDVNIEEDVAILAVSTPLNPGDAYLVHLTTKEYVKLTNINDDFLNEVELQKPEEIVVKGKDGWDIHGWVMKPYGYEYGKKYPAILEIHGGPHTMYANTFFHEMQLLAAQGYFVMYSNPRGSFGYGQQFVNACRGDYGGMDYEDLMSFTDGVLAKYEDIDEERLGVTGGSYGGFMTNWIITQTDRFKAAVTARSISNWISFYGVSDIGYFFTDWELGTSVLKDPEKLWNYSPLKYVTKINTPLLILHAEQDYRCPIEQAEQLFVALKHLGKETRFVRFPDANHELSRSGKPYLRILRLEEIVHWFNKYLKE